MNWIKPCTHLLPGAGPYPNPNCMVLKENSLKTTSVRTISKSWSPPPDVSSLVRGGWGRQAVPGMALSDNASLQEQSGILWVSFGVKEPDCPVVNARLQQNFTRMWRTISFVAHLQSRVMRRTTSGKTKGKLKLNRAVLWTPRNSTVQCNCPRCKPDSQIMAFYARITTATLI